MNERIIQGALVSGLVFAAGETWGYFKGGINLDMTASLAGTSVAFGTMVALVHERDFGLMRSKLKSWKNPLIGAVSGAASGAFSFGLMGIVGSARFEEVLPIMVGGALGGIMFGTYVASSNANN